MLKFLMVVLPDPFRGMGVWRNLMEIQQSPTPQGLEWKK